MAVRTGCMCVYILVDQVMGTGCMYVYILTWWIKWWELSACVFTSYSGGSGGGNWLRVRLHPSGPDQNQDEL